MPEIVLTTEDMEFFEKLKTSEKNKCCKTLEDLRAIKCEFYTLMNSCPEEVADLENDIAFANIDGRSYASDCGCLYNSIARARADKLGDLETLHLIECEMDGGSVMATALRSLYGENSKIYNKFNEDLASDKLPLIEQFVEEIRSGDYPEHEPVLGVLDYWIRDWKSKVIKENL